MTTRTLHPRIHVGCRDHTFLADVLAGLSLPEKRLPCKYFYDECGSRLFEQICELPEYYPTRTELGILRAHAEEISDYFGPLCGLIEYGSGSSRKTRLLLERLRDGIYYPVDISREHLHGTAERLAREFSGVEVVPVHADFTRPFALPASRRPVRRRVAYFSGSTIGNFPPGEAVILLGQIAQQIGPGGGLLIGVDRKKDRAILEAAYDDASGVTAAFNLNLLARINRELGGDFALDRFAHRAFYNELHGRIEMHLVSQVPQVAHLGGLRFPLRQGETICTEYSYKFSLDDFARLAATADLTVHQVWCDPENLFSVQYLERPER